MILYGIVSIYFKYQTSMPYAFSLSSLGENPAQAWSKHLGISAFDLDFPIIVMRWFERGWRVKQFSLTLLP